MPIYFLTAIPGKEVEKKVRELGAIGAILKPFNLSDFDIFLIILNLNKDNTILD